MLNKLTKNYMFLFYLSSKQANSFVVDVEKA